MAKCIQCGRQLPAFSFKKLCPWCVQHEAAQRGEEVDDIPQPVIRRPWAQSESSITLTQILLGANVAVYLAMAIGSGSVTDIPGHSLLFGANYGPYTLTGQWWRLVAYMFLHGGIWHIGFNMWCLWDLGQLCESLYGRWTYAMIYFLTGIAAGLASIGWNPVAMSVGASGAIFGLAGALAASYYLGEFSLPSAAVRPALRSLVFFIGFNVVLGIGYNVFLGGNYGNIDNAAHIGGLISGLILGAVIARLAPKLDSRRVTVLSVAVLAILGFGLFVRQWRIGSARNFVAFQAMGAPGSGDKTAQLKMLAQQDPKSVPLHSYLAQAYFTQQKYPEAEAEFKKLVELRPKSPSPRFLLGMTYLSMNRPEDAKAAFNGMLQQGLNPGEAHYGIAMAFAMENKHQDAIDEFKHAIKAGAAMSEVYSDMAKSYLALKQYDDAIAAYMKAKEIGGDSPDVEIGLAEAYQAQGRTKEAQTARSAADQLKQNQQTQ